LFIALLGLEFIHGYRRLVVLFFGLNILYYGLFFGLFPHWGLLSKTTARWSYPMIHTMYPSAQLVIEGNEVGLFVESFNVGVGEACSGVMLLLLFCTLYTAFIVLTPIRSWKRGVLLLLLGTLGAFFINILRVTILVIIGVYNPQLAMGLFHQNATWILFVSYFLGYLALTYRWVYLPSDNKPPTHRTKRNSEHQGSIIE
jgi:exosortase/archaeosortase family protein